MDRSGKIAQAYGYAVCLIAVITLLFSSRSMIDAVFDMSTPLRADRYSSGVNLTSFEAYKRDRMGRFAPTRPMPAAQADTVTPPSEEELRRMFQDERAEHIANVRFRSTRSLVSSALMLALAVVLFATHWRWLRRSTETA